MLYKIYVAYSQFSIFTNSAFLTRAATLLSANKNNNWHIFFSFQPNKNIKYKRYKKKQKQKPKLKQFIINDLEIIYIVYKQQPNGSYKAVTKTFINNSLN